MNVDDFLLEYNRTLDFCDLNKIFDDPKILQNYLFVIKLRDEWMDLLITEIVKENGIEEMKNSGGDWIFYRYQSGLEELKTDKRIKKLAQESAPVRTVLEDIDWPHDDYLLKRCNRKRKQLKSKMKLYTDWVHL